MARDRQSLAAIERDYRQGPPWLLLLFAAMFALLAMFFILNAQVAQSRDARVDALGIERGSYEPASRAGPRVISSVH